MSNLSLKRKFLPTSESQFSSFKKFKIHTSPSNLSTYNSSSQSIEDYNPQSSSQNNFTVPQPFVFQTELRSRKSSFLPTEDLEMQILQSRPKFKAKPVPKFLPVNEPEKLNKFTIPQEFNFLTNTRERDCKILNQRTSFSARPCPDFSRKFEVSKQEFRPTKTVPFNLKTENRQRKNQFCCAESEFGRSTIERSYSVDGKNERFRSKSGKNDKNDKNTQFVARPMPDFSNIFIPVICSKHTQPMEIELNTGKRVEIREKFEAYLADKENLKKEEKTLEMKKEEEALKDYRKTLEFKARPLQELNPFFIRRSEEELTTPKSPSLYTKKRAQKREKNENDMDID